MTTETAVRRQGGGRSPAYPFIPLGKAIDRAGELRTAIGKADTRMLSALHHWGYRPKSSGGLQTVAALKHFKLLEDAGSGEDRRVKLTERALRILLDERPNSPERLEHIRKAALSPKIHSELWERWGAELPVDEEIRHYLIFDRSFNENGARDLIAEYKATLDYAGLLDSGTVSAMDEGILDAANGSEEEPMQEPTREMSVARPTRFYGGDGGGAVPQTMVEGASSLVLYNDRIRVSADVDLEGAKELMRKLQKRIELLEEEKGAN